MPTIIECCEWGDMDGERFPNPDCKCIGCYANRLILAARDEALEEAARICGNRSYHVLARLIRALRSPQPRPPLDPDARDDGYHCVYCNEFIPHDRPSRLLYGAGNRWVCSETCRALMAAKERAAEFAAKAMIVRDDPDSVIVRDDSESGIS